MFFIIAKYFVPKGYIGLTVFPFVFLRERHMKDDQVLVNHEKIHLRQQLELLVVPFFIWYFVDYLVKYVRYKDRKLAYRNIVFEREAYANENNMDYLLKRPMWHFANYFKNDIAVWF